MSGSRNRQPKPALSSLFRIVDTRLSSSICGQFIYIYRLAVSYLTWHIKFVALPIKDGDFPQTVSFLVFRSQHEFSKAAPKIPKGHHSHGPKWGNNQAFARVMAGIFNDGVEIAQIRVLAFSGAGAGGDFLGIYMWVHDGGVYGLIYGCLWCYNAEIYCINPIYCPIGSMYGIYIWVC